MITRILLVAICVYLSTSSALLYAADAQCPNGRAVVYFANGIRTFEKRAEDSVAELQQRLAGRISESAFQCLDFDVAYNPTALTGNEKSFLEELYNSSRDVAEAAGQDVTTFSRRFWTVLTGIEPLPDWLTNAFLDSARSVDRAAIYLAPEIQEHVKSYVNRIQNEGKKVIVVGHSQGNFFANQGYFLLPDEYKESLGLVAIATFDSFVAGQSLPYEYTTLEGDLAVDAVVQLASQLPYFGGIGCTLGLDWTATVDLLSMWPLCANTQNDGNSEDSLGHDFLKAYLIKGSNSEAKILADVVRTWESLRKPTVSPSLLDEVLSRTTIDWSADQYFEGFQEGVGDTLVTFTLYLKDRFTNVGTRPVRLDSVQFIYLSPEEVGIPDIFVDGTNRDQVYAAAASRYPNFYLWGLLWRTVDPEPWKWSDSLSIKNLGNVVLEPGDYIDIEHTTRTTLPLDPIPLAPEAVFGFKFTGELLQ